MHRFKTGKENIAESLIRSSLVDSALKRSLAHAAEHLLEIVISTRKASMPSAYQLPELLRALHNGDDPGCRRAFKARMASIGENAKRTHPKCDNRNGRSRLGLKPSSKSLLIHAPDDYASFFVLSISVTTPELTAKLGIKMSQIYAACV